MEDLSLEFLRVVEQAAIACAHTMGQGDRHRSDQAAVEAMRACLDDVPIDGTIVIGEGERDEAPMLYIGERVGRGARAGGGRHPEVDIAVDPLEGTNLCATGAPNALSVLAASNRGGLLHAPDLYMEKLVGGEALKLFRIDGFFVPGLHSRPLSDEEDPGIAPDLVPLRQKLMNMVHRPVNIQATGDLVMFLRGDLLGQPYLTLVARPED